MKNALFLFVWLLAACQPHNVETTVQPSVPERITFPGSSFSLIPTPSTGLPYNSDSVYWRVNGSAIEFASHCTEIPGKRISQLKAGDSISILYSNDAEVKYVITDKIIVRYASASDPYSGDWIVGEKHYSVMDFTKYIVSLGKIFVHVSICPFGTAVGQFFFIGN